MIVFRIAEFSGKVKEYLMHSTKESFVIRLRERLFALCATLPMEAIINGDVDGCLKQVKKEAKLPNRIEGPEKIIFLLVSTRVSP